jgi:hypothetical protein
MPLLLIIIGLVLVISAARGTHQQLFFLVAGDFTGANNFIYWFLSIAVIGSFGYIPKLKPVSDAFLVLLIVVLFFKKDTGFFAKLNEQIGSTASAKNSVKLGNQFTGSDGGGVTIGGGGGGVTIGGGGGGITIGGGGGGAVKIGIYDFGGPFDGFGGYGFNGFNFDQMASSHTGIPR